MNKIYDEALKLIEEKKADNAQRELVAIDQAMKHWFGDSDDLTWKINKLTTEGNTSQPRGDFKVDVYDGDNYQYTYWVEVKNVGDNRWAYLDDFKIPMPTDFRRESGWTEADRFLFVIVNGETGQARMFEETEPWEIPLKRWKSWNNAAGWDRMCFPKDLTQFDEFQVDYSEDLMGRFAEQRDIRMYGGY